MLAALTAVALLLTRRRTPAPADEASPSPDATLQVNLSDTVLQRLDETEEYLDKTITLDEMITLGIVGGFVAPFLRSLVRGSSR